MYDSGNAILVTAGADSAIKVHSLSKWLLGADISKDKIVMMRQSPKLEVFSINLEQEDSFRKNGRLDRYFCVLMLCYVADKTLAAYT